jgi:hypothetical protein
MEIIYKDNDNLLQLSGLKNSSTDAFVNNATVTLTAIKDSAGNNVAGISWPLTMGYVAASDGDYEVTVDKAVVISASHHYTAFIDAVASGLDGHWELPLICKIRTS